MCKGLPLKTGIINTLTTLVIMLYHKSYLLTCFVALSMISSFASHTGMIAGKVSYADGTPASDVVINLNTGSILDVTDELGQYQLNNVPIGTHTLIVKPFGQEMKVFELTTTNSHHFFPIQLDNISGAQQLVEVEVNGKTVSRQLKDNGFAMGVVETQKMALQSVQTNELLDRAAGVRIRQSGGMGSATSYNINGLSGNSVRIFIDGIPVRNYGSSFSLSSIPPAMIERIEVYKGVVPPHLSEDALGGAINVVLKKMAQKSESLTAAYSVGSFNTHQANLSGRYFNDSTGFTVTGSAYYNYTDNNYEVWGDQVFVSEPPTWSLKPVKAKRFHDSYRSYGVKLDAGYTEVKWADRFTVGILASDMDKDVQHGGTMEVVYGNRRTGQSTRMINTRFDKKNIIKNLDINAFASYTDADRWVTDTLPHIYNWLGNRLWNETRGEYYSWNVGGGEAGRATMANNTERTLAGRVNAAYRITDQHRLNANYFHNQFTRDIDDPMLPVAEQVLTETRYLTKQILGLSYESYWIDQRLKTTLFWKNYRQNVRLKDPVKTGNTLTHLDINKEVVKDGVGSAFSYTLSPTLLVLTSFEKAVRLPESSELLGNTSENINAAYNLSPESSYNVNLGLNMGPFVKENHVFRTDVNLFYRDIRDMIMRGAENTSTGNYAFENLGQILSKGVDLEMGYNYGKKLTSSFNLSLFNARYNLRYDANGNEYSYYGDRLRNAPYFTTNTYVEYNLGNLLRRSTNLSVNYNMGYVHAFFRNWESIGGSGKAIIPSQLVHDVGLVYNFADNKTVLSFNAKNITNEQAFDNWALQKPGRAFYLKMSYQLF
jgi:outer membrane receptor protein involved in Fe transport